MPEQFALQQRLGNGGAVDGQEWGPGPRAVPLNGLRQKSGRAALSRISTLTFSTPRVRSPCTPLALPGNRRRSSRWELIPRRLSAMALSGVAPDCRLFNARKTNLRVRSTCNGLRT